jgi:hypothetical protein
VHFLRFFPWFVIAASPSTVISYISMFRFLQKKKGELKKNWAPNDIKEPLISHYSPSTSQNASVEHFWSMYRGTH